MIEQMKAEILRASAHDQKTAMFHFQVLKNAKELEGVNAKATCMELGVPESYAKEFTKMLNLARLMDEQGVKLIG